MREEILQRFRSNVARVRNLITLYRTLGQNLGGGGAGGRRAVNSADILRAATVLLHGSLEDVLRGVLIWKFPVANEQVLDGVPLVGLSEIGRAEKFLLGKLVGHRDKVVRDLIDESVRAYARLFTVNNTTDIAVFCNKAGVDATDVNGEFPLLAAMIERRHHIVHQADRNEEAGSGHHLTRSLSTERVEIWTRSTERFVEQFLEQVPDELI